MVGPPDPVAKELVEGLAGLGYLFFDSEVLHGRANDAVAVGLDSFNLHVRQTRINLDLRRPVASDDLRIFVESDFFGLKPNLFRLRHAYGRWRNLLVGQSFSTFMDVDALVDTLDFEGPPNTVFVLQPQVRYTVPLTARQSLAFSIEKPTTVAEPPGPAAGKAPGGAQRSWPRHSRSRPCRAGDEYVIE